MRPPRDVILHGERAASWIDRRGASAVHISTGGVYCT
jgi:hypothetical protein